MFSCRVERGSIAVKHLSLRIYEAGFLKLRCEPLATHLGWEVWFLSSTQETGDSMYSIAVQGLGQKIRCFLGHCGITGDTRVRLPTSTYPSRSNCIIFAIAPWLSTECYNHGTSMRHLNETDAPIRRPRAPGRFQFGELDCNQAIESMHFSATMVQTILPRFPVILEGVSSVKFSTKFRGPLKQVGFDDVPHGGPAVRRQGMIRSTLKPVRPASG